MSHADKVIEAIKAMTPEERVQSLISAGIIREDGTLMPQYGGTSSSGDIPTPETDAATVRFVSAPSTRYWVKADFARDLERRLAAAMTERDEARKRFAEAEGLLSEMREFESIRNGDLLIERDSIRAELAAATARAEEAERIIRNGEEQTAALKRLVPFCHHPANLVIGSAEGWICCECWAQQNEDALRKIAALPTDQTASLTQCEAVLIAMDALEASPSVRPDELQSKLTAAIDAAMSLPTAPKQKEGEV